MLVTIQAKEKRRILGEMILLERLFALQKDYNLKLYLKGTPALSETLIRFSR
jgi:hypothetical protein